MSLTNRPGWGGGPGNITGPNDPRARRLAQQAQEMEQVIGDGLMVDAHGRLNVDVSVTRGEPGERGPVGSSGIAGQNGLAGEAGAPGADGLAGPQGPTGATGRAGEQGDPGAPGAPGAQGDQGDQGEQGEQGATGPQGDIGPSIASAQDLGIATTIDSNIVSDSSSDWAETDANAISWNETLEQFVVAGSDVLAVARDSADAKTLILTEGLWLVSFHLLVEENANSDFAVAFKTVVGTGATAAYEVDDLFRSAGNSSAWVSGAISHHEDRDFAYSGQFLAAANAYEVVGNTTLGKDLNTADTTWVVTDSSSLVGLALPTPATLRNASGATEDITITTHGHHETTHSVFELDYTLGMDTEANVIYEELTSFSILLQAFGVGEFDDPTHPIYGRLDYDGPGGPFTETVRCVRVTMDGDPFGGHFQEWFMVVERDPDNLGYFGAGASTITRISTLEVVRGSSPITGAAGDVITYNSNEIAPMNMRCQMTCESAGVAQMEGRVTFLRVNRLD